MIRAALRNLGPAALALLFAGAVAVAAGPAAAQTVADVPSPRGETTRILVETAADPWVTVLLFAGGQGGLELSKDGAIGNLGGNFLIRTRDEFRAAGANTVVIDAPSDRSNLKNFRDTEGHAEDIGAVVRHLRASLKVPVWVVGTSNGTVSAANAGVRLAGDARPDGVVLTSTRLETNAYGTGVLDLDVEKITGPVLIAHHRHDNCHVTPPERIPDLAAGLTGARPLKVLWYEGGEGARGNPCHARHYHGFIGIEAKVVADIMAWIKRPAP